MPQPVTPFYWIQTSLLPPVCTSACHTHDADVHQVTECTHIVTSLVTHVNLNNKHHLNLSNIHHLITQILVRNMPLPPPPARIIPMHTPTVSGNFITTVRSCATPLEVRAHFKRCADCDSFSHWSNHQPKQNVSCLETCSWACTSPNT